MPYATRRMFKYMKEKGLSNISESDISESHNKKKVRELPSSIDPIEDESSSKNPSSSKGSAYSKKSGSVASSSMKTLSGSKKSGSTASSTAASNSSPKTSASSKKSGSTASSIAASNSSPKTSVLSKKSGSTASSTAPGSSTAPSLSRNKSSSASKSMFSGKPSGSKSNKSSSQSTMKSVKMEKSGSMLSDSSKVNSKSKVKSSLKVSKSSTKKIKVISAAKMALGLKPVSVSGVNYNEMAFDEKRVQFIQTLLRSNVKKLSDIIGADSAEASAKLFEKYTISSKPFNSNPHSAKQLNETTHCDFPKDCVILCKQYDSSKYDPKSSLFLRILRHLGKKHPNIIQTWDILLKGNTIFVFQELAPYNNLSEFVNKKGVLNEDKAQTVARQTRLALDFMGDMGISHRSITPNHMLLVHVSHDFQIKLTGFRNAIIYYDEKHDDVNYQPCIPLSKKSKEPDYVALEVFGDPEKEQYDPINADVWSFGASLYFIVSKGYPFQNSGNTTNIEDEIQGNVLKLKLTKEGMSAIGNMLVTDSTKRISIDKLKDHPWFFEK
ncbi:hypothetical protein BLOT_009242 [Blomia tropicalis]|nr:hypothetical protein BLOT_009242 [Blomia tropicalis]